MTIGLAVMLYLLSPSSSGVPRVHWYVWLVGVGVNLALAGGRWQGLAKTIKRNVSVLRPAPPTYLAGVSDLLPVTRSSD